MKKLLVLALLAPLFSQAQVNPNGAIGGLYPAGATAVGAKDANGKLQPLKLDASGALVTAGGGGGGGTTAPATTGTINNDGAGAGVTLTGLAEWGSVWVRVSDPGLCNLRPEVQRPDGSWVAARVLNAGFAGMVTSFLEFTDALVISPTGGKGVRVYCDSASGGSPPYGISVAIQASAAAAPDATLSSLFHPYENFFTPTVAKEPPAVKRTHGSIIDVQVCNNTYPCYLPLRAGGDVSIYCETPQAGDFSATSYTFDNHAGSDLLQIMLADGRVATSWPASTMCAGGVNTMSHAYVLGVPPGAAGVILAFSGGGVAPWALMTSAETALNVTNLTVGKTANAVPTATVQVGGSDGTNLRALSTNSSGRLQVDVVSGGGSNASVGATGAGVPASATYSGMNVAGNLTGLVGTANGLKVDGSAVTQPVSHPGATTSGALTTNGSTVSLSIDGYVGAGVSFTAGLIGTVVFETSADGGTTWATALPVTAFGNPISTGSVTNPAGTYGIVTVGGASNVRVRVIAYTSGSCTATLRADGAATPYAVVAGTAGPITQNVTNGAVAVFTLSTTTLNTQGAAASGSAKSGNPVQVGGVFNTTQPTVTTGQAVEAQSTARGALIVAPGVDGFQVSAASLPLPTGAATEASLGGMSAKLPAALGPQASAASLSVTPATGATFPVSGSVTASGTVTANQGTAAAGSGAWPVAITDTSNTVVKAGDAGNNAVRVNVVAGAGSGGTASSFGAAFPATGTAIGAKDSSGTNMAALNLDASGFLKVNVAAGGASGGTSSSFGAAVPATGTAAGFSDGTNMVMGRAGATNADAEASLTAGAVETSSHLMGYNGATWDRVRTANTGRLQVDVVTGGGSNASVSATGAAAPASATYAGVLSGGNLVGLTQPLTDTQLRASAVPISASALPLPTGAATETTLGTRLADATFTGRINTQGQKAMAASTPVVIASDQSAISVSGTVTANAGTGNFTVVQGTGTNLHAVIDSGTVTATVASTTANQGTPAATANAWPAKLVDSAGTNVAAVSAAGAVKVDGSAVTQPVSGTFWQATQPVSGTVTATQGTGTNLHTVVDSGTITTITNAVTVAQGTAANLRAQTASEQASAAATSSTITLAGGATTTAAPTYTTGQANPLSLQTDGSLRVAVTAGGGSNASVGTTGAATPASATLIAGTDGTNLRAPVVLNSTPAGTEYAMLVRTVGAGGGGTSSSFAAAFPATGTAAGAKVVNSTPTYTNGNMEAPTLDTSGNLRVNVVAGGGAGGTSSTFAAAFPGTGTAAGMKVVTSEPTYTNGNMEGPTGDVNGNLRVSARTSKRAAAVVTSAVSCANTATAAPASPLTQRTSLCVLNNASVTIYLGASGVTTSTGFPLQPGATFCDDVGAQAYYCIVASGTAEARLLEN